MKIVRLYFKCELFLWAPYRFYDCSTSLNHSCRDLPMNSVHVFCFVFKESKYTCKPITCNHSPAHRDLKSE